MTTRHLIVCWLALACVAIAGVGHLVTTRRAIAHLEAALAQERAQRHAAMADLSQRHASTEAAVIDLRLVTGRAGGDLAMTRHQVDALRRWRRTIYP